MNPAAALTADEIPDLLGHYVEHVRSLPIKPGMKSDRICVLASSWDITRT